MATPIAKIPGIVDACRRTYQRRALHPLPKRKELLHALVRLLQDNRGILCEALKKDLGKCSYEAEMTEICPAISEVWEAINHLESWASPEPVGTVLAMKTERCYVQSEPLGTVLIIGAWNYPVGLVFSPMVGAIAAGNSVVVKPSEVSVHTSAVVAATISKYFNPSEVSVVSGGVAETTALLDQQFDHILYTGNSRVARIVMAAAAKNLTPVTLELGGKSPTIVDDLCDFEVAARRIVWGRILNAGQTCIAPDYLLVKPKVIPKLVAELKKAIEEYLGKDSQKSPDYGRIVNAMHFKRVSALMSGGKIVYGGRTDEATRYIEPTIIEDVDLKSALMTDEIFGPLFPIIPYNTVDDAIEFVNARPKPLAMYIFSNDSKFADKILANTSSGGATVNDTLMHIVMSALPFGGVGESGMGSYHGKRSFDVFSHKRSIMKRRQILEFVNTRLRCPPYTATKLRHLVLVLYHTGPRISALSYLMSLVLILLTVYFLVA